MGSIAIKAPNHPMTVSHLPNVIRDMRALGSPTIRVYDPGGGLPIIALEGSHRLAAAVELNVPVELVYMNLNDQIYHDFHPLKKPCSVAEILAYLQREFDNFDYSGPIYTVQIASKGRHLP